MPQHIDLRFAAFLWLSLYFHAIALGNEPIKWLYSVEVPVTSQSIDEVQRAARSALDILIVRMIGTGNPLKSEEMMNARSNVDRYYLQYRFQTKPQRFNSLQSNTYLRVDFDPISVQNLVRRLGLPVWGANRPSILLWLVITGPAHDAILERSDQGEVAQMVYEQALRRGIPLMVPLMDIQDRRYASASLMRGPFTDRMLAASKRYEPGYIAIARVHATKAIKPWVVELSLSIRDEEQKVIFTSAKLNDAVARLVNEVADILFNHYAVSGRDTTAVLVTVDGISTTLAYARLLNYLLKWEFIDRVDAVSIEGDSISLNIYTTSNLDQLAAILLEDGILLSQENLAGATSNHNDRFLWNGAR